MDTPPPGGYLRDRREAVDYILITHSSYAEAAGDLAAWRSEHSPDGNGFRVAVVDVQDIYDEFSAGRVDPTAIRNFLRFAFEQWNGGDPAVSPSYVLLLGDAAYDFRDRLKQGAKVTVPAYEGFYDAGLAHTLYSPQFASDDWFVLYDPEADPSLEMAIGRLPADTPAGAQALVEKVRNYETAQDPGSWRQRFTLGGGRRLPGAPLRLSPRLHAHEADGGSRRRHPPGRTRARPHLPVRVRQDLYLRPETGGRGGAAQEHRRRDPGRELHGARQRSAARRREGPRDLGRSEHDECGPSVLLPDRVLLRGEVRLRGRGTERSVGPPPGRRRHRGALRHRRRLLPVERRVEPPVLPRDVSRQRCRALTAARRGARPSQADDRRILGDEQPALSAPRRSRRQPEYRPFEDPYGGRDRCGLWAPRLPIP